MKRVHRIWQHSEYQRTLKELEAFEKDREFCRHTPQHFLDVARLTCLLASEAGTEVSKELIYAAGLLHDIGRLEQYQKGIPHEKASAEIAAGLLPECGFDREEQRQILKLIENHRTAQEGNSPDALFYQADKLSRNCFCCPVRDQCDWPDAKKNLEIRY